MNAENLSDLLKHEVKDLYSAETQILDALPKMIEKSTDQALTSALKEHFEETRGQKERLEKIGKMLGVDPTGHKCKGMAGIIKEGEDTVEEHTSDEDVRNAAIVGASQRVEHYEMAGYGTARTYARMLGNDDVAELLEQTLDQEKSADSKLSRIAEDHVNKQAKAKA